jgi:uncharacterized glyoxalase superfamily protein PhnB
MKVNSASAIFQVADLQEAIAFYTEKLNFETEFLYGNPPFYAGVRKDDVVIHLNAPPSDKERIGMGSIYIFCDKVDSYYETIKENGVEIRSRLATYPYGMRDFQIKDLDGNFLCFGAEVECDD